VSLYICSFNCFIADDTAFKCRFMKCKGSGRNGSSHGGAFAVHSGEPKMIQNLCNDLPDILDIPALASN